MKANGITILHLVERQNVSLREQLTVGISDKKGNYVRNPHAIVQFNYGNNINI